MQMIFLAQRAFSIHNSHIINAIISKKLMYYANTCQTCHKVLPIVGVAMSPHRRQLVSWLPIKIHN